MSEDRLTVIEPSGMEAIPGARGVTFRVWAPRAEKVYSSLAHADGQIEQIDR